MAKQQVGLISQAAQWDLLFASKNDFDTATSQVTRDEWLARLDEIGEETVLETVAAGRLPVEIAISNRIPMMLFREWMEKRVDPERLKAAARSHAEVSVLKSQLSLAAAPETPAEAAVQKELSHRYAWVAERMDPERWGPPQKKEAPLPTVSIVMQLGKRGAMQITADAQTIEGTAQRVENAPGGNLPRWGGVITVGADAASERDPPLPAGLAPRPTLEQRVAARRPYAEDAEAV